MHVVGRPGQFVSSSFPNAASANKSEQVVIFVPVGWEWDGWDIEGLDNVFHHHFQMQLLQTRVDIFRVWQVVISASVGWEVGGGDTTGYDNAIYHHFQMQLLQTRVNIFGGGAGSNLCPCWLGMG
jgi:hypothetical protein